jgi:hypothetical protein
LEEVLLYKKLDGVPKALAALAEEWFPGGRQRVVLNDAVAALKLPVQSSGGGKTGLSRSPMPKRSHHAFRFTSSNKPDTCRTWKKRARSIG